MLAYSTLAAEMKGSSAGRSASGVQKIAKPRIANSSGEGGGGLQAYSEGVAAGQHPILGDLCTRLFIGIGKGERQMGCGHWPSAGLPTWRACDKTSWSLQSLAGPLCISGHVTSTMTSGFSR